MIDGAYQENDDLTVANLWKTTFHSCLSYQTCSVQNGYGWWSWENIPLEAYGSYWNWLINWLIDITDFNSISTCLGFFWRYILRSYFNFCTIVCLISNTVLLTILSNTNNFLNIFICRFIWLIDETSTGTTTQGQSGPGCYDNEGVIHTRQIFRSRASISD